MMYQNFTVHTYRNNLCTGQSFRAESPIPWSEARDRLVAAGVLTRELAGRTYADGGWMLSVDPADFSSRKAVPLP